MTHAAPAISRKILFVDDEILLLNGIKRHFRGDFDISIAQSGAAALAMLAEQGPFAVVVSDYNMPGMDGIGLLNAVFQQYPDAVLMMLTGRAELDLVVKALHNAHISRFLNKPCPKEILQEALNDGVEQYRLRMTEQLLRQQIVEANEKLNQLNSQLETLVDQKTAALTVQYTYAAQLTDCESIDDIIALLFEAIKALTSLSGIQLWLNPQQNEMLYRYFPQNGVLLELDSRRLVGGILADVMDKHRPWIRSPAEPATVLSEDEADLFSDEPLACFPLMTKQSLVGLLTLSGAADGLAKEMIEALTGIANVSATALQSLWHREANAEAQDAIISSLAKLAEYRDPETGLHLLRLKKYCELLCDALAELPDFHDIITPEFKKDLIRSSPLHDIGKVGIEDAILKKPGRLTVEEFKIMKHHAAIGGDTLRAVYEQYPSQNFIKCGMEIAYGHHERWDGSGYPAGQKGAEIPITARILALADVYDALTTERVYKPRFTREVAKKIILEGSGTHFDPDVVAVFIAQEESFHLIAESMADSAESQHQSL